MNGYDAANNFSDGEAEEGELILDEPPSRTFNPHDGRHGEEFDYEREYDARSNRRGRNRGREEDVRGDPFRYKRRFLGRSASPASSPDRSRRPYDSPYRERRRRSGRSRSRRGGYDSPAGPSPRGGHKSKKREDEEHGEWDEEEEGVEDRILAAMEDRREDKEERLIEERRRKRREILERYRRQQQTESESAGGNVNLPRQEGNGKSELLAMNANKDGAVSAFKDAEDKGEDLETEFVDDMDVDKSGNLNIWRHPDDSAGTQAAGARVQQAASPSPSGIGEADNGEHEVRVQAARAAHDHHESLIDQDHDDVDDDMFAETPEDGLQVPTAVHDASKVPVPKARRGLVDNFDDAEGYYNFQVGEIIGQRYEVLKAHGKGVFSSVLRAKDINSIREQATMNESITPSREVAIKVIRSNDTMYRAGQMEKVILRKLAEADPDGRRHCIRMLGSFEYRQHLCLVFEPMDMDLRGLTKRYGRGIGLSLSAVRIYTQQMLVALHHLRNCGVIHADIKPDNILVNDRRTVIKLCDFGSAMFSGDNELTPYLVSRFYRAPEVILGLPYDHPMDMWSVGCVVYELFTGQILFPGKTNNEMLKLMMDVKGPFPKRMLKKGQFAFKHFETDPAMSFALVEEDAVTRRPLRRLIPNPTIKNDFSSLLAGQDSDRRKLAHLADLLERMMALDPDKRIIPKEALNHPFIRGNVTLGREKTAKRLVGAAPRAVAAAALRQQK